MLVGDIVSRNARVYGAKVGLVDDDAAFTYSEINRRVNRLSNALIQLGIEKRDRVAVMAHNSHQFVEAYFAAAKAGFVIVPVNTSLGAEEAAEVINHSDAVAFVFDSSLVNLVRELKPLVPGVSHFITTGTGEEHTYAYDDLLEAASEDEPLREIDASDPALIMYTSGSTGSPKGVIGTHRNIVSNTNTMVIELQISSEDITLVFMPLFHNGGLWPTLTHFYRGATVILQQRFREDKVLEVIEKKKVTVLNVVPTMLSRLLAHQDFDTCDYRSLRLIMHGGGPISGELLNKAMRVFGPSRLYTSLGCTEANGMLTSFPTTEHALEGPLKNKITSVGRDAIGVELKIVANDGVELPSGKVGEIIASGENISPGYWKNPKETAETFKDGWLYLGDLGYRDDDGYIFVVDRKKNIVISGGENISCGEVESVIQQHPGVQEVAVIGMPDERWGEVVMAVVCLKPEFKNSVTHDEVMKFCGARLANFKKPKSVRFIEEFPRTALGKIARATLKQMHVARDDHDKANGTKSATEPDSRPIHGR